MKLGQELALTGEHDCLPIVDWGGQVVNVCNEFEDWVVEAGLTQFNIYLGSYYEADYDDDIDYPAIMFAKSTPRSVITMCILRWGT